MRRAAGIAVILAAALASRAAAEEPLFGADLSYVNEMEDCGAVYREGGVAKDPFALMREHGANVVRVRLWNGAKWTRYSDLKDVEKTIRRAKAQGMKVLLDFHYSDTWADGDKQPTPAVWKGLGDDALADAVHRYTLETLTTLAKDGLAPELVQVGNEINPELLGGTKGKPIDWMRNAKLINAGIRAVREAGAAWPVKPRVMLHIAQPENVEPWFEAATRAGVTDFDLIGISYYRKWSTENLDQLGATIARLRRAYPKAEVVVAETAYPWTLDYADSMPNLLGEDSLIPGYPATPAGQAAYLRDLSRLVLKSGGSGVIYWEPAWVSTHCRTPFGVGSGWENATFFDFRKRNETLPAIGFPRQALADAAAH